MTERQWPLPHDISDVDFNQLCKEHGIDQSDRDLLRAFVGELVEFSCVYMRDMNERGTLTHHRSECEKQTEHLRSVRQWVQSLYSYEKRRERTLYVPPEGIAGISDAAAYRLSLLLSPSYLARFGGFKPPHSTHNVRNWAHKVIEHNSLDVILAVVVELEKTLADAAAYMEHRTPRGGPHRYFVGPWFLMNVAGAYSRLGRKPAKNVYGPFGRFSISIVLVVGWETDWIDSHIRQAVSDWERRSNAGGLER